MANATPSRAADKNRAASLDHHRTAQTLFLVAVLVVGAGVAGYILLAETMEASSPPQKTDSAATPNEASASPIPFDGAAAYGYLKQLCDIGPRMSGSPGMAVQQKLLIDHFEKLGAKVTRQEFKARDPLTGNAVPMTNLLVQWHPDRKERVLLFAHYDTRPFPDRDRRNPKGKFVGANDGASGVAS